MKVYRVGGAVRDRLLGRSVQEQDYVVVGASPERLLDQGFQPVGRDFPVFLHPVTHEEYALARLERKSGPGYKGFSCYSAPDVTLEDDLKRRDLTINAMAETIPQGELIDPYGGCLDLQKKILRHVSPAFKEDPVRILRVARFMARFSKLGFKVAPETLQLMREMVKNGEVHALVAERIWRECLSALKEPNPEVFINTLRVCGALAVVCPELEQLFGMQSYCAHGTRLMDCGQRSLETLKQAVRLSTDPYVRFVALMLPIDPHLSERSSKTSFAKSPIYSLNERWRLPVSYLDLLKLSMQHYQQCHQLLISSAEEIMELLEQLDAYRRPNRLTPFFTICEADWYSCSCYITHKQFNQYPQREHLIKALAITRKVTAAPLLQGGLRGQSLGLQLRKNRKIALQGEGVVDLEIMTSSSS